MCFFIYLSLSKLKMSNIFTLLDKSHSSKEKKMCDREQKNIATICLIKKIYTFASNQDVMILHHGFITLIQ